MHELSVTEDILNIVLRHAAKSGVSRIEKIFLEIGELSDLEEEWLSRYFSAVSRGTPAENAALVVTRIPCRFHCLDCGCEFDLDLKSSTMAVCPACGGESIRMINIMASPGAGKTSLILKTAEALKENIRLSVIEADIDSLADAEKLAAAGIEAVQLHTGGFCHVDAYMMRKTLDAVDLEETDLLILENVGNLICPAQSDTGAALNIVISSVPEGDDKPLKYPLIFRVCDVLIINKIDFLPLCDFDIEAFTARSRLLNPKIVIFELSCRTGEGVDEWTKWLREWC